MRPHLSCHIVFGLFFISQVNYAGSKRLQEEELLELQLKVENLVEKMINFIQDFNQDMKTQLKCIPDYFSEALMEILKNAVICVEENEKDYNSGKISAKTQAKNFLKCLTNGKNEIRGTMESIDNTIDYCPDNVTEKTYQINVTTTFSKTFRINIKNGLEIMKKEIELNKDTKHSLRGEEDSVEEESEEDESSDLEHDKRDAVTRGGEGQYGIKETDLEKPKSGKEKNNRESSTTEGGNNFEYDDSSSSTETSTRKTKLGHRQGKQPKEGKSKKPNESEESDYTDDYDSELSTGSSEDSHDDSNDEEVHHVHRQFF